MTITPRWALVIALVACDRAAEPAASPARVRVDAPPAAATDSAAAAATENADAVPQLALAQDYLCRRLGSRAMCIGAFQHVEGDPLTSLSGIREIGAGENHACLIDSQAELRCWGDNGQGQLGDGTTTARWQPRPVVGVPRAKRLAVGHRLTCALFVDESIWCWGGLADTPAPTPRKVKLSGPVRSIASGFVESCAALPDGSVRCWSRNTDPQPIDGLSDIIEVSLGSHACALRRDGSVWCWGNNANGQLGTEDGVRREQPKPVPGIASVVQISAGAYSTCARHKDGGVSCWGASRGPDKLAPERVAEIAGAVEIHALYGGGVCAVFDDGYDSCVRTRGKAGNR